MNPIRKKLFEFYHSTAHQKITKKIEIEKKNNKFYVKIWAVHSSSLYYKIWNTIFEIRDTARNSILGGR